MKMMESPVHRTISRYTNSVPRYLSAIYDASHRSTRDEDGLDRGQTRKIKGSKVEASIVKFNEGLPLRPQRIYAIQKPKPLVNHEDDEDEEDENEEEDEEEELSEDDDSVDVFESDDDIIGEDELDEEETKERLAGGQNFEADKEEQRATKMVNFFYQLYKSRQLCDLTLRLGDREFAIHSLTFVEHSDKYYNLMCGGHLPLQEIILDKSTTPEAVEMVLDFLYTGEIKLTDECLQPVLRCAKQLDIRHVIDKCNEYIRRREQLSPTRELVTKSKSRGLLANSRDFLKLDVDTLCSILSDDDVDADSEIDIFYAALQWLDFNKGARQHHALRVMECIRFGLMSPTELLTIVEVHAHLMRVAEVKDLVYQAYKYHALNLSKSPLTIRLQSPKPRLLCQDDQWSYSELDIKESKLENEFKTSKKKNSKSIRCVAGGSKILPPSKRSNFPGLVVHKPPRPKICLSEKNNVSIGRCKSLMEKKEKKQPKSKSYPNVEECEDQILKNRSKIKFHQETKNCRGEEMCTAVYKSRTKSNETNKRRPRRRTKSDTSQLQEDFFEQNTRKSRSKPELICELSEKNQNDSRPQRSDSDNIISKYHNKFSSLEDVDLESDSLEEIEPKSRTRIQLVKKPEIPDPPTCTLSNQTLIGRLPIVNEDPMKENLYVFGGTDLECSDPNYPGRQVLCLSNTSTSKKWIQVEALMPVPRNNHCALVVDSMVYIIGGALPVRESEDFFAAPNNTVIAFDPSSCEWIPGAPMNFARLYFAAASAIGKIFVFGGQGVGNSVLNSVECYEPVYDRWSTCASMCSGRVGACASTFRKKIFVIGGYAWCNGEATALRDCFTYDPLTDSWCQLTSLARGLCYASVVTAGDNLYLIGGAEEGSLESQPLISVPFIRLYDSANDNWKIIGELKIPRHDCCTVSMSSGKKIYVVGGLTLCNRPLVSVECFDTEYKVLLARVPKLPYPSAGTTTCVITVN